MTNQTKFYLGIDVSKPYFDLSLMREINHSCQPIVTERFDNTLEGIKHFHQFLKKLNLQVFFREFFRQRSLPDLV